MKKLRVVEFFAGIGGLSCAWPESETVAAIDINRNAKALFHANFDAPYWVREIESLDAGFLRPMDADIWWLSPPCQPYSRRGKQQDVDDPRTKSLLHVLEILPAVLPFVVMLENVTGFESSLAWSKMQEVLSRCGYQWRTITICPSEMAWPNRRPRFYVLATLGNLLGWTAVPQYRVQLKDLIDSQESASVDADLWLDDVSQIRFEDGLDRIILGKRECTACFGASYGKSIVNAGSYLKVGSRYRRFSPQEVARLLGFPQNFQLGDIGKRAQWKLLGNSLSLPAVRYLLSNLEFGPSKFLPEYSPIASAIADSNLSV